MIGEDTERVRLNPSDKRVSSLGEMKQTKSNKKRNLLIGGGVAVVVLVVVIILIASGGSDDGGGDKPGPGPGPSPVPPDQGYNPYTVDESKTVNQDWVLEGQMSASGDVHEQHLIRRMAIQNMMSSNGSKNETPSLIDPSSIPLGANNQIVKNLKYQFGQLDYTLTHLYLTDADNERYEPPSEFVRKREYEADMRLDFVGLKVKNEPFSFSFSDERFDPPETILTTEKQALLMMDKYIQMDFVLPSQRIYGFGERNREFHLTEGTWTMWATGRETPYDDGSGGLQTYGVHPFALVQTKTKGRFFGMYFRNTNAQSPVIQFNEDGTSTLSYITTGGVIDVYFFLKASAKQIISQYQNLVGLPALPPFWALGWHAASYGYQSLADVDENVQGYKNKSIPLEGVWLDIPYMDALADFSVNQTSFPDLKTYTQNLQSNGQKMVVIVDAGISADDISNKYFAQAATNDLLIKSSIHPDKFNGALSTTVWPNHTVFLDFLSPNATKIWEEGLKDLYDLVPYDGLWLDMNEICSFCDGECPDGLNTTNSTNSTSTKLDSDSWYISYADQGNNSTYFLPFIPGKDHLDFMTMSPNATHPSTNHSEFDVHSIFGMVETHRTRDFLVNSPNTPHPNKRPFMLTRSTFAGSGNNTAHWLGDNHREWAYMNYSIAGVMSFNMFGIPMVGPDTCGFFKSEDPQQVIDQYQICGRWFQLATFYPFARQHRDTTLGSGRGGDRNEPWLLQEPYQTWAKNSLYQRLEFVRQLYTCLFEASFSGQSCYDPMLFHYPMDDNTFEQIEHSFIFANSIKVSPVLAPNVTEIQSYFPAGNWVSIQNLSDVVRVPCPKNNSNCFGTYGEWVTLPVANDSSSKVHGHIKPGSLLSWQNNGGNTYKLTSEILQQPITIVASRNHLGHAEGKVFLDDGESLDQLQNATYEYYTFQLSANSIKKWRENNDARAASSGIMINEFLIVDAEDLNETDFACLATNDDLARTALDFAYDNTTMTLTLKFNNGSLIDPFTLRDIYFGNSKKDINLCNTASGFYHTKDFAPVDLTTNQTSILLESSSSAYMDLNLTLSALENGMLNIYWSFNDSSLENHTLYEVPLTVVDPEKDKLANVSLSKFVVATQDQGKPLQISVTNENGQAVFDIMGMVLTEYFNFFEATAKTLPNSKGLTGLYDRTQMDLFLDDGVFTLWPRDINHPDENGKPPGKQDYGVHPMVFGQAADKTWFGVYSNVATAQDWWVKNNKATGEISLKSIATGGLGDLYFFFGATPNELMVNYHKLMGKPVLNPQWILGWGQCRWGYNSTTVLREIVQNYTDYDIPLDHQWTDIDYLDNYKIFTYNHNENFKDLPQFVNELHEQGRKYVPIIDIGIAQRGSGYDAYTDGLERDVFLKTEAGEVFSGRVWPGDTAFPDWSQEETQQYWVDWLNKFQDMVAFDGIWLDMNEPSTMCDGPCYEDQRAQAPVKYKLHYIPGGRDLEDKSVDLDALGKDGHNQLNSRVVTPVEQLRATNSYFRGKEQRAMIISRGNFAGLGKYGSRWGGDNNPTAANMGFSNIQVMYHNFMGIPLAGSDICGVGNNTTPELCARWHVVGAFYPFSRNHNWWLSKPQEPWVFDTVYSGTTSYTDIMRFAIKTKYSLIRYYYTQLSLISETGGAFVKPLFFEFPDEPLAYVEQYNNMMLGEALKLSVLADKLDQNSTAFQFPAGTWCDIARGNFSDTCFTLTQASSVDLPSYAFSYSLHLREGYIVPKQEATEMKNFTTSQFLQQQPVDFHINPLCAATCNASGVYLNDDGEVLETDGYRNVYNLSLSWDKQGDIILEFQMHENATQVTDFRVNENDRAQNIYIYNAKANGYDGGNYTASAQVAGAAKTLPDAAFDEERDALWVTVGEWLPDLESITLSKK